MESLADFGGIIDMDTHVVEPYDLWTSRISTEKFGDDVPHVKRDPETNADFWYFGKTRAFPAAAAATAGGIEHYPEHARSLDEVQLYTWKADERLKLMDQYGIRAQVLFPNVVFFDAARLIKLNRADLMLDVIRAYNDWQSDWSSIAPDRLLPQSVLPFWDIKESVKEMERCVALGHRGIVLASEPHHFGQPKLTNRHWDPLWAAAQEMKLPVNFHIGSTGLEAQAVMDSSVGPRATAAANSVLFFMSNAAALTQIICGGICHRFPDLNFISVESGVGWLPFALQSLDWQWKGSIVREEHPEYDLLPSEYFRRQIYGSFWFETRDTVLPAIAALGDDNVLFETDFPHPTSMSPGPNSEAQSPPDYLADLFRGVPQDTVRKILHDNAARLYHMN